MFNFTFINLLSVIIVNNEFSNRFEQRSITMHARTHEIPCMHARPNARAHACTHACMHGCMDALDGRIYAHAVAHAHMYVHIRTNIEQRYT